MSAEGHYAGWTANAHTRGPVLSLVTNWSEVLRQSIKLKVNMGHHGPKQLVNFLCPKNPVSSQALVVLPAPQTPTKGKKMQKVWRFWAWLCAREVAANPSSVAPVEPDVAAGKDQIFSFSSNHFAWFPIPLESMESNGVSPKNTLPLSSLSMFRLSLMGIGWGSLEVSCFWGLFSCSIQSGR